MGALGFPPTHAAAISAINLRLKPLFGVFDVLEHLVFVRVVRDSRFGCRLMRASPAPGIN
ncbi:MAG: hypothetical protein WAV18_25410 [Roseiarcus sp.]